MAVSKYKLNIPPFVLSVVKKLHPNLKKNVKAVLKEIAQNHYSGKVLQNELEGLHAYRIGKFRVVYKVEGKIIQVIVVGPRATIYQDTLLLIKQKKKI